MFGKKESLVIYLVFFISCFLIFFGLTTFEKSIYKSSLKNSIILNDNWSVKLNDKLYGTVDLDKDSIPLVTEGDVLEIETTLPKFEIVYPQLLVDSVYSAVTVFVNDEMIYQYGEKELTSGDLVSCKQNFITLQNLDKEENTIRIIFNVAEPYAFSSIDSPIIHSASERSKIILRGGNVCFIVSIFLVVLGAITVIVSVCFKQRKFNLSLMMGMSQFALWTGLGVLSNNGFLELFSMDVRLDVWIEYLSLFMMPISISGIFYEVIATNKLEKNIAFYYVLTVITYGAISTVLHIFNIKHFPALLSGFQLLLFIGAVYCLYVSAKSIKKSNWKKALSAVGFIIMMLLSLLDLSRYVINKFTTLNMEIMHSSLFSIGAIIFIVCSLMNYIFIFSEKLDKEDSEEKSIRFDYLTGFYNRQETFNYLHEMDLADENDYVVAIIDIPNYSVIAQQKGSFYANNLLHSVTKKIKKIFDNYGIVGRLADNQFIVIAHNMLETKLKQLFFVLKQNFLTDFVCKDMQMVYGIAFGYEANIKNVTEACNLASSRAAPISEAPSLPSFSSTGRYLI